MMFGRLYIPLCLYFNCSGIRTVYSSEQLYIPLCLYFNQLMATYIKSAENFFTFHYVSILIFA